ncbi:MAG: hypothetical protein ACM3ZC_11185 [Bacteroidota bacterium]
MRHLVCLLMIALLALIPLSALAATRIVATPGAFALAPMTDWDKIKNDNRYYSQIALTDKPANLEAAFRDAEKPNAIFGVLQLGSPRQAIHLAMGRAESNCVDFLYLDVNNDKRLTAEERVEIKKNSPFNQGNTEYQWSESVKSVACNVSYMRSNGTLLTRPVTVQFYFLRKKPLNTKTPASDKFYYYYVVNTWFYGKGRFDDGKADRDLSFAILDGNDNGLFNDFGQDYMLIDANEDSFFDMQKEIHPLVELDEERIDSRTTIQRRKLIFAWPVTMVVQPVVDAVDFVSVEPR